MRESEYRIRHFEEHFHDLKGSRIFLYGTGKNTEMVLRHFDQAYQFEAVIAPDEDAEIRSREKQRLGKPVITLDEAVRQHPEILLIAAEMHSAEKIYQRIQETCRANGVRIMDLYGTDQMALHDELAGHTYQDLEGWKRQTAAYDVVSFELLDTVIERDMFCARKGSVRPVFRRLIPYLKENGKKVLFIADPQQEAAWYRDILERDGISLSEKEFSDTVFFQTWKEAFFRDIREKTPGNRFLHIGYSLADNGIIPRLCGFDTYRMVFFDIDRLTAFTRQEETSSPEDLPEERDLLQAIDEAEGVSMDIFDTLLVRKTADPRDVFVMTAGLARCEDILPGPEAVRRFCSVREEEQVSVRTLDRIYEETGGRMGLSTEQTARMRQLEFACEKAVVTVRKPFLRLLQYARDAGKKTILTSDMYLREEEIHELFAINGESCPEPVLISCEYGLSKQDGLLHRAAEILGLPSEKILHIGDSLQNDILPAQLAGMKAMKAGPLREEKEDREAILYRYGFTAAAPVIAGWMFWFLHEVRKHRPDKVLFAARDGWLLQRLYEDMRNEEDPGSVYFYVSRRAAFLLSSDRPETEGFMTDMTKDMPEEHVREHIFEAKTRQGSRSVAERARSGYASYLKELGLDREADLFYVDFVASGTSQRMLEEVSPFRLHGRYFGRPLTAGEASCEIRSFIAGETETEKAFLSRYLEMEYYMSSEEPSLRAYGEDGKPVFAEEVRNAGEIEDIRTVHRGIRDYFDTLQKPGRFRETEKEHPYDLSLMRDALPAETVCRMYLASTGKEVQQRYFDDWSGRWLSR